MFGALALLFRINKNGQLQILATALRKLHIAFLLCEGLFPLTNRRVGDADAAAA